MSPSRVWADVGPGLGGVTGWHICEESRQLADRLLIRTTRWARPEPATRGQVRRRARRSGQIRSESPRSPKPILTTVHPQPPPKRHTHRSADTTLEGPRRANPRVRTSRITYANSAINVCRSEPNEVLAPLQGTPARCLAVRDGPLVSATGTRTASQLTLPHGNRVNTDWVWGVFCGGA
jgi:hypothetical protein